MFLLKYEGYSQRKKYESKWSLSKSSVPPFCCEVMTTHNIALEVGRSNNRNSNVEYNGAETLARIIGLSNNSI